MKSIFASCDWYPGTHKQPVRWTVGFTSCNHRLNITQQHGAASARRRILKWLDPCCLLICCVFPLWSHVSLWGKQRLRTSRHLELLQPFSRLPHTPPPHQLIPIESFRPHLLIHRWLFLLSTRMERSRFISATNRLIRTSCNISAVIWIILPSRLGSHRKGLGEK